MRALAVACGALPCAVPAQQPGRLLEDGALNIRAPGSQCGCWQLAAVRQARRQNSREKQRKNRAEAQGERIRQRHSVEAGAPRGHCCGAAQVLYVVGKNRPPACRQAQRARSCAATRARAHGYGALPAGPAEVLRRLAACCCLEPEPVESCVTRRDGEVSSRSAEGGVGGGGRGWGTGAVMGCALPVGTCSPALIPAGGQPLCRVTCWCRHPPDSLKSMR